MIARIRWRFTLRVVAVLLLLYITIALISEYIRHSHSTSSDPGDYKDIRIEQQPIGIIGERRRTLTNDDDAIVGTSGNAKAANYIDSLVEKAIKIRNEMMNSSKSDGRVDDTSRLEVGADRSVPSVVVKEKGETEANKAIQIRNRIFHWDLKGAPPKLPYFKLIFEMIATRFGATGILLEYEDMFPWEGELAVVRNRNAYSSDDVRQILAWANEFKLDIIPLVQTFGHLEWILKYEQFAKYRQDERYPQVFIKSELTISLF